LVVCLGSSLKAQTKAEGQIQQDSTQSGTPIKKKDRRPRKATIMSAVIPGLGQVYNKKYWKPPIIYGLGALIVSFILDNQGYYQAFSKAYNDTLLLIKNGKLAPQVHVNNTSYKQVKNFGVYSPDQLIRRRDYYRRNRDLNIIFLTGVYVINIVDACVDAHLKNFNVNDNLTLNIQPKLNLTYGNTMVPGICINLNFRK
jgi:hypothetical protein